MLPAVPEVRVTSETAERVGAPLASVVAVKSDVIPPTFTVAVVGVA